METLDGYRKQIDEIDRQLTALFEQRMDVVERVAEFKKANNVPILHTSREEQVVAQVVAQLQNPAYSDAAADFIRQTMRISREHQAKQMQPTAPKRMQASSAVVGFQGTAGSFSEEALLCCFGQETSRKAFDEFEDVFAALQRGEIGYGVLPIENSYTGGISAVYDLLEDYRFFIVGEVRIPIRHHLIGVHGASLSGIREVYSHSQGFEQCSEFLRGQKHVTRIPYLNTAISAQFVSQNCDPTKAAIASEQAARLYGLDIIKEDIQNKKDNSTRFIVIAKELSQQSDCNKVSVLFSMDHKAGSLHQLLGIFAEHKLNLVKIESRPTKNNPWTYYLYADFEGSIQNEATQAALAQLAGSTEHFRVLGCYRTDHHAGR